MYGYNRTRILYAFGIVAGILIVVIGSYVYNSINGDKTRAKVLENQLAIVAKLSTFNQADIGPGAGNPLNPSEIKSFIVCDHGRTRYAGVADDTLYLPGIQIEQNLTEEQIPVYSLIMKFEKTQLYDNIWR